MKKNEFLEGPKALENFERGMKALFRVSKDAVVKAEKKQAKKRASSRGESARKPKVFDKD